MKNIWKDNLRLRDEIARQNTKRPPFDPAQLTWVPRKRHNTKWPVNPPTEHSAFIAKLQPFIKFELHPSQIEEAILPDIEESSITGVPNAHGTPQKNVPKSPRVPEAEEPAQQLNRRQSNHRRRTLRPSLSTITEATDETSTSPLLTLTPASTRHLSLSPAKRSQWPAHTSKTPTKVAESPLKDFVMNVSPKKSGMQIAESQNDQAIVAHSPADREDDSNHVPLLHQADQGPVLSPSKTESTTSHAPVFNHAGHFRAPSSIDTESTTSHTPVFNQAGHFRVPSSVDTESMKSGPLAFNPVVHPSSPLA